MQGKRIPAGSAGEEVSEMHKKAAASKDAAAHKS